MLASTNLLKIKLSIKPRNQKLFTDCKSSQLKKSNLFWVNLEVTALLSQTSKTISRESKRSFCLKKLLIGSLHNQTQHFSINTTAQSFSLCLFYVQTINPSLAIVFCYAHIVIKYFSFKEFCSIISSVKNDMLFCFKLVDHATWIQQWTNDNEPETNKAKKQTGDKNEITNSPADSISCHRWMYDFITKNEWAQNAQHTKWRSKAE